jgi:hypothetical protein
MTRVRPASSVIVMCFETVSFLSTHEISSFSTSHNLFTVSFTQDGRSKPGLSVFFDVVAIFMSLLE